MSKSEFKYEKTIPEFYKGKNVFITGGTGFMGKVFIEKLLRSCPDLGNIYILMRSKKGKTIHERLKQLTDDPVSPKNSHKNLNHEVWGIPCIATCPV